MSNDPIQIALVPIAGESYELREDRSWESSNFVISIEGYAPQTSFLFNGKGGGDNIYGSQFDDYIWVEGDRDLPEAWWGSYGGAGSVYAYGRSGNDVFRIYTNPGWDEVPPGTWRAQYAQLHGDEGDDVLFINGEHQSSWDLTSLHLNSIETLALAWYPQGATPLEVRLTQGQWDQLRTIHVDVAHQTSALKVFIDGAERINWQSEKTVLNQSISGLDYNGGIEGVVLGSAGSDHLNAPPQGLPVYIKVSGDAVPGSWEYIAKLTTLDGSSPPLNLPAGNSMDSRIFHVDSDGSYLTVSRDYGTPATGGQQTLVISKFTASGATASGFGVDGKVSIALGSAANFEQKIIQDADGNLLFLDTSNGAQLKKILVADGSIDSLSLGGETVDSLRLLGAGRDEMGADLLYFTRGWDSYILIAKAGGGGGYTVVGEPVMAPSLPWNSAYYFVDDGGSLKWRRDTGDFEGYSLSPDGELSRLAFGFDSINYSSNQIHWDESSQTLYIYNPTGVYQDAVGSKNGGLYWINQGDLVAVTGAVPGGAPALTTFNLLTVPPPIATGDGYSSEPQGLWVKVVGVGAGGEVLLQHEIGVPAGLEGSEGRIFALSKHILVEGAYVLDTSVGIDGYAYRPNSVDKTDVSYHGGEFVVLSPSHNWGYTGDFILDLNYGLNEGAWVDEADDSGVFIVNNVIGDLEFVVYPIRDSLYEGEESFTLELVNAYGSNYVVTGESLQYTILNDTRLPGVDLNGSEKGGATSYHDRGTFDYGNWDEIPLVDNHMRFWDAHIGSDAGVSALRLSIDTAKFDNLTNEYDWAFGWEGRITDQYSALDDLDEAWRNAGDWIRLDEFTPDYASGLQEFHGGFRIPLTTQDLGAPDTAVRFVEFNGQLLLVQQVLEGSNLVLTIQTGDGVPLSASDAEELLRNNVGIAYNDLAAARSAEFRDRIEVGVEISSDGSTWISADPYQAGTQVFEFHNEPAVAVQATFDKNFIEVVFQAGPVEDLNYEVADISFDDWYGWRGEPDPAHFSVVVDGRDVTVLSTYQMQSVLLVLSEDISDATSVQVTYTDPNPNVDDIYNVIQSWGGADTPDFDLLASKASQVTAKLTVGSGAQLGWDDMEAEDRYFNAEWGDFHTSQLNVVSVSGGVATVQFEPVGWMNNANFDPSITDPGLLVSYPYVKGVVEIKIDASFSIDGVAVNLYPGASVAAADVFGYNSSAKLFSFGHTLLVSQDGASEHRAFDLATYTMPDGIDASIIVASEFLPGSSMEMLGGAYDDTLGLPLNLNAFTANAGGGNDLIYAGISGARIDGGLGVDTVVFNDPRGGYTFNPDDALSGSLTVTGPGVVPGTLVTYTLRGVEKMEFSDEVVLLPNAVVEPFDYTPEFSAFVENVVWDADGLGTMIATGTDLNILDLTALRESNLLADIGIAYGEDENGSTVFVEVDGYTGFIVSGNNGSAFGDRAVIATNSDASDLVIVRGELANTDIALKGEGDSTGTFDVLAFVDGAMGSTYSVTVDLNTSNDEGYTTFGNGSDIEGRVSGVDGLIGASGGDAFTGYVDRANALFGGAGEDQLVGGDFGDLLVGGSGAWDYLEGRAGDDILVDFDGATMFGGDGKDLYVVSDGSVIEDFGYADDGASRPGRNSSWDDRVAFAINLSTLQGLGILQGAQAGQELSIADYTHLMQSVEFEAVDDGSDYWTINAFILQSSTEPGGTPTRVDLGNFETYFKRSESDTNSNESIKVSAIPQDFDVARVWENVLPDAMLSADVPTQTNSMVPTIFDGKVLLFAGLEIADSSIVRPPSPPNGEPAVLFARDNGRSSTVFEFEPLNTDTVAVGGGRGDEYRFAPATAPDHPDVPDAPSENDVFKTSLIIDRGSSGERDFINLGDLTVDQVDFSRIQVGKEGEMSLGISWDNVAGFNDGDVQVAYQYSSLTSKFRIEDVELSGDLYDLGAVKKQGAELHTSDNRDAILVGRDGVKDTFVINKGDKTNGNDELDIFLWDFENQDVILLDGFGSIAGFSQTDVSSTMKTITFNDGSGDWTVNLHARGTGAFDEDFLLFDRAALT